AEAADGGRFYIQAPADSRSRGIRGLPVHQEYELAFLPKRLARLDFHDQLAADVPTCTPPLRAQNHNSRVADTRPPPAAGCCSCRPHKGGSLTRQACQALFADRTSSD